MPGSLDGIRIVDLTTIYSGPICTSILGDQGADVIKVESPEGDWMRTPLSIQRNGVGAGFAMMNRNKRSVVIDIKTDEGKQVLKKLIADADVLVENFRPGVMERLGLAYETVRKINKGIIYASINGVGHSGPYSGRRVYDAIIQAVSGIGSLQADPKTERPILVNSLVCDKLTSITAAQVISSALVARERTGTGQRVDISMLESSLYFLWPDAMLNYTFVGDDVPYMEPLTHTNFIRKTKDGFICTMPVQADEWQGLFQALELPNLMEDQSLFTETGMDMVALNKILNGAYERFTTAELLQRCEKHQVPFANVNSREEVIDDPQVVAMESLWEFDHPIAGAMRQARPPGRFSETPAGINRHSPELGEHTWEVLEESGYTEDEIKGMRVRKVVR